MRLTWRGTSDEVRVRGLTRSPHPDPCPNCGGPMERWVGWREYRRRGKVVETVLFKETHCTCQQE